MIHASTGVRLWSRRTRWRWVTTGLVLIVLFAAGCDTTDSASPDPGTQQVPLWIDDVTPEPGATLTATDGVSVAFQLTDPDHTVRLVIDGIDVTAGSLAGPGLLRYEDTGPGVIELQPGNHTAVAQLVIAEVDGVEAVVVDEYRWSFRTT